jgi:hypothetical protein
MKPNIVKNLSAVLGIKLSYIYTQQSLLGHSDISESRNNRCFRGRCTLLLQSPFFYHGAGISQSIQQLGYRLDGCDSTPFRINRFFSSL